MLIISLSVKGLGCSGCSKLNIINFYRSSYLPWYMTVVFRTIIKWGETGGSETPASSTFYSRFPPPSIGVSASLFSFYCRMLRNNAKFFFFSPGSHDFGNPASRPFSSRLPYSSRPYSSGLPLPCPPPPLTLWLFSYYDFLRQIRITLHWNMCKVTSTTAVCAVFIEHQTKMFYM